MSKSDAISRVRLYKINKKFCASKGYILLPSKKEKAALNLLGLGVNNV